MVTIKKLSLLWLCECLFISIIILAFTLIRVFDPESFNEMKDFYKVYAEFDADTSLVYDGEVK